MPSTLFLRMANDPEVRDAEERVMAFYRRERGMDVDDCRDSHRSYDMILRYGEDMVGALDVKLERTSCRTGNFSWEHSKEWNDGKFSWGWGMKEDMDYVTYVRPWPDRVWEGYTFDAKKLRKWMPLHGRKIPEQYDGDNRATIYVASIVLMTKSEAFVERFDLPA